MNKPRAVKRLSFYFRTIYDGLGWEWLPDNQAEIEELVDWLMEEGPLEEGEKNHAEYYHGYRRMKDE